MSTRQLGLFDDVPMPIKPADPHVPPEARKRLKGQCMAILRMLRERPRTASELVAVSHRFGARLFDLKEAGCVIDCDYRPRSGHATYTLIHEPEGLT